MRNIGSDGDWTRAKEEMVSILISLGHPRELGELIARQLGSPKAIRRMTSYLEQVRPRSAEEVVDEMLAIYSEIEAWHRKKESEQANASYTEYLNERKNGPEE